MHTIIGTHLGRILHSAGHRTLTKTRPVYAFIPEEFFGDKGFRKGRYLVSRWPSINAGANPLALGSHVIPDPESAVNIRSRCPVLAQFLRRLETIASIKIPSAA